jgi:nitroreductase
MTDTIGAETPDIGLFDAIYTQRAIRRFKPDPVSRELLAKLVEAATKAPSGGNQQPWAFVVIDDPETLKGAADIARKSFDAMYSIVLSRQAPGDPPPMPNLKKMIDEIDNIPAWIVVCGDPPSKVAGDAPLMSLMPAVQNLLLAARGLGLGAVLTGLVGGAAAKELLGLPDHVDPVASIPLGLPADGVRYGTTTRRPVDEVTHWGRWNGDRDNTAKTAYRAD